MIRNLILYIGTSLFVFVPHIHSSYAYLDTIDSNYNIFQQLAIVVGLLDKYEEKEYAGLKVDFGTDGKYYSRFLGNNWWEYFFKKVEVGDTHKERCRIKKFEKTALSCSTFQFDTERAHYLIQKYIFIQPKIVKEIAAFETEYLNDSFTIGVNYIKNNTSAYSVPTVQYKLIYEILLVHLVEKPNVKIFVHTNDARFYAFLKVKHPDNVMRYKEETNFELPADEAEHELINCLLLSKADLLICTPSRFSLTVSQFNPSLPMIEFGEVAATRTE